MGELPDHRHVLPTASPNGFEGTNQQGPLLEWFLLFLEHPRTDAGRHNLKVLVHVNGPRRHKLRDPIVGAFLHPQQQIDIGDARLLQKRLLQNLQKGVGDKPTNPTAIVVAIVVVGGGGGAILVVVVMVWMLSRSVVLVGWTAVNAHAAVAVVAVVAHHHHHGGEPVCRNELDRSGDSFSSFLFVAGSLLVLFLEQFFLLLLFAEGFGLEGVQVFSLEGIGHVPDERFEQFALAVAFAFLPGVVVKLSFHVVLVGTKLVGQLENVAPVAAVHEAGTNDAGTERFEKIVQNRFLRNVTVNGVINRHQRLGDPPLLLVRRRR